MSKKDEDDIPIQESIKVPQPLDPKARRATVKHNGIERQADRTAITPFEPCEFCGREIGFDDLDEEFKDWLLAEVRKGASPQANANPVASPIPPGWINLVAGEKARIENTLGREVEGIYPAEVPAILKEDPSALCYPPFAHAFACCLENADPAVWKVLKSFFTGKGAAPRPYTFAVPMPVDSAAGGVRTFHTKVPARFLRDVQRFRAWNAHQAGMSDAEIAKDEGLTARTVRSLLGEARRRLDPHKKTTGEKKEEK